MNVLLLGSGGREHALAWKLAQSNGLDTLYAAPGNPGIAAHATCVGLNATDHAAVVTFVKDHAIGLVVVGPEAPLVDGLADSLRAEGIPVFGPSKAAAQLEGSKGFTKDLCRRADIPTAGYVRVNTLAEAQAALATTFGLPVVIKADGLAAGKGVTVAFTKAEAEGAITDLFSVPGAEVVIEEFLEGEEASLFVLTDGEALLPFGSAQDHKRVGDGDTGPNTGGMGAYSPARVLTPELEQQAIDRIVRPTVDTLRAEGTPFSGVLYAGLMLTAQGPKLIEYNARFGDPECQVLMLRFQGDLLAVMLAVAEGRLAEIPAPAFSQAPALTVVMAAAGYPGTPKAGGAIDAIDAAEATGAVVFQAGTKMQGEQLVASGGRVLAVTASAATVGEAQAAAYRAVDAIRFPDGFCRRDIGWREIAREAGTPA
ncbi:phosphoribosylamine--glycine ligase [Sphingomonas sanguinis]|jgi:phosphoribosylamine--glycine ligase|uniref:Phosphoribosylamine--glycine ligase n=1 Tax=Sphingomonas sanguinis TaxID=33051 RepID=A0A7Y7QYK9_9SPHN|nr:phosphoribosylamine--glycine ligase [Sphingomonas sanguinis]MBZ6383364.1 phosphoribosylamine--glycine ligase [Sphingomonas sanguinis]NNG48577.1 phosphoribosylamine--glycine ligase [Sphingomonas sanguinis]NNG54200.1 phosphoribosylamine--glycine ligase [Sphingomonas sanguinis]NVP32659.1 phosphoribosylamine--glycine ligase [Sphingomonas sanguinis]